MCAAIAGAIKPDQFRSTVMNVWLGSSTTVATPVAGEPLGGTSCVPLNVFIAKQFGVGVGVLVSVGVNVSVAVAVAVGVSVGVSVAVLVGVATNTSPTWKSLKPPTPSA